MKRFAFQIIFITLSLHVPAQTYTPFPANNAFWSAMHCEAGPMVPKSGMVKVGIFGDTVINSKEYHKLYLQRKYVNFRFSCDTCGFVFDMDQAFYFISFREENKIIYFVPQQNGFDDPPGTEYPVFNFNVANVGETVLGYEYLFLPYGSSSDPTPTPGCGVMMDTVRLTVESIDHVIMSDGSFRRRINFMPLTYGLKESWIEGIGSTKGFGLSLDVTNSYNTMICYSHDGINLGTSEILSQQLCTSRPDSTMTFANRCEFTAPNSKEDLPVNRGISVFPNPVIDFIKFTGLFPGDKVTIYNVLGEVIYMEISKSEELEIDRFGFDKGIYMYTVTTPEKKIVGGKFIKY